MDFYYLQNPDIYKDEIKNSSEVQKIENKSERIVFPIMKQVFHINL